MRFATYVSGEHRLLQLENEQHDFPAVQKLTYTAIGKLPTFHHPERDEAFSFDHALRRSLQGRLLFTSELPFSPEHMFTHYERGYVGYVPSVKKGSKGFCCVRCGNEEQRLFATFACARCQELCTYCRKCIVMGRASECTPLLYWRGPEEQAFLPSKHTPLVWDGQLSKEQSEASKRVKDAIFERRRLLIWAVCGSGKTEILFAGLAEALRAGLTVCIATPRVDVVLELTPRLRAVFPSVDIGALYGGSKERGMMPQLTVATTHQLLRFRQRFDVMIVDEVDAFPYDYDPMLAYAVERAKKTEAATIFLTATPNDALKKDVQQGRLSVVKIPIRYHRHPLPVPRFHWVGNWERILSKGKLPQAVLHWCAHRIEKGIPFFLFVPSVMLAEEVTRILRRHFPLVASVYAEDTKRKEKVEQFRRGEWHGLITTTILERGVTIPRVEVAVLGAEAEIFTESALVQIAGRVGREASSPQGDVCFFHYGITKALVAAKRHIVTMNEALG